jgi:S1-C subfamily serine protease
MVVLSLAVVALGLVVRGDGPARAAAPPDSQQRINLAVVAIDARIGGDTVHSSGTVVDPARGLILTSNSAIWGATSLRLGTALGLLYGRVVARAPCDDLALIETLPQLPGLAALPLATGAPRPGDLVTSVGRRRANPDFGANSLLQIPALQAAAVGTKRLALDSRLVPESIGGPLIDGQGQLIGIAVGGTGSDPASPTRALSMNAISDRLDELRPGPRTLYVGWRSQYSCAGRLNSSTKAAHPGFKQRDAWLTAPVDVTRLPGTEVLDAG